jgi:hypothetical protein
LEFIGTCFLMFTIGIAVNVRLRHARTWPMDGHLDATAGSLVGERAAE